MSPPTTAQAAAGLPNSMLLALASKKLIPTLRNSYLQLRRSELRRPSVMPRMNVTERWKSSKSLAKELQQTSLCHSMSVTRFSSVTVRSTSHLSRNTSALAGMKTQLLKGSITDVSTQTSSRMSRKFFTSLAHSRLTKSSVGNQEAPRLVFWPLFSMK